ncbi:MAG TPA: carbohydrate-binding family 9-like protein [Anaerovoracaceae bacterium]|nr:carbohydrate-binding family 9-like protein [Anaerovoracaceae bacterium]
MEKSADFNFSKIKAASVTAFPWNCVYRPETAVQIAALEDAFAVRMRTGDRNPRTEVRGLNGPVYTDSCMEFFFMPDPEHSKEYINWEFNSAGALFISFGADRLHRHNLEPENYTELFHVETKTDEDGWEISYRIPYEFLREYFPGFQIREGGKMRGNFFKCAEKSEHPHYGCWASVDLPQPDFHSPDFFGDLILK